jgi:hypothetical protein
MLENTVRWRRDYKPDELDPDYIKPEVRILKRKEKSRDKSGLSCGQSLLQKSCDMSGRKIQTLFEPFWKR